MNVSNQALRIWTSVAAVEENTIRLGGAAECSKLAAKCVSMTIWLSFNKTEGKPHEAARLQTKFPTGLSVQSGCKEIPGRLPRAGPKFWGGFS